MICETTYSADELVRHIQSYQHMWVGMLHDDENGIFVYIDPSRVVLRRCIDGRAGIMTKLPPSATCLDVSWGVEGDQFLVQDLHNTNVPDVAETDFILKPVGTGCAFSIFLQKTA